MCVEGGSGWGLKVLGASILCEEEKEMPLGNWLGSWISRIIKIKL